jgi:group I intron endonuclease
MKREINCGIYCIRNLINGKRYIGWASDIAERFWNHKWALRNNKHSNNYLQRSWNKYTEKNFIFEIIEEYPLVLETLRLMEIYFIAYYDSFVADGKGYNLTRGGEGNLGWIPAKESIEKMRVSHLGKISSEEQRKKQSIALSGKNHPFYGMHRTEEQKRKQSEKMSGENHPLWGTTHSPETIEKMREAKRGQIRPQKTRDKISESLKGNKSIWFGKKMPNSYSNYLCVTRNKASADRIYWRAKVGEEYIGQFKTEIEAAKAADKYIVENNVDRPLNFPDGIHPYWEIE